MSATEVVALPFVLPAVFAAELVADVEFLGLADFDAVCGFDRVGPLGADLDDLVDRFTLSNPSTVAWFGASFYYLGQSCRVINCLVGSSLLLKESLFGPLVSGIWLGLPCQIGKCRRSAKFSR